MVDASPGPWNVHPDDLTLVVDVNHRVIAVPALHSGLSLEKMEANAQIMGAAKDLFAACNEYHRAVDLLFASLIRLNYDFKPSQSGQPFEAMIRGRNAMHKAREIDYLPNPLTLAKLDARATIMAAGEELLGVLIPFVEAFASGIHPNDARYSEEFRDNLPRAAELVNRLKALQETDAK